MKKFISTCLIVLFLSLQVVSAFAAGYDSTSYSTLKYGSRGSAVIKLQQELINKGFLQGPPDGIYGSWTEKAVIKFQIANRIRIDGIAGKETQFTLYFTPTSRGMSTTRNQSATGDLYWLSRIIEAEAGAEPYNGKVAVGNVILNRVSSNEFPDTIKTVIFEYYQGIPQFSPVAEGTIYNAPSQESIQAAKDALNGIRPAGNATYFFNPDKAEGRWIVKNKIYVMRIGHHVFYK
jgi:N-acetylmuramoyl-L-alanine amidase